MKEKKLFYINAILVVSILIGLIFLVKNISGFLMPVSSGRAVSQATAMQSSQTYEAPTSKPAPSIPPENIRNLKDVYANYPKEDAGSNLIEAWSRVKPEDKAKYIEGVDKYINEAKKSLEANPSDKKAKHMLFISETMKKLAENNFNYGALDDAKASESKK